MHKPAGHISADISNSDSYTFSPHRLKSSGCLPGLSTVTISCKYSVVYGIIVSQCCSAKRICKDFGVKGRSCWWCKPVTCKMNPGWWLLPLCTRSVTMQKAERATWKRTGNLKDAQRSEHQASLDIVLRALSFRLTDEKTRLLFLSDHATGVGPVHCREGSAIWL